MKDKILNDFKTVIDFYRMEYTDDLTVLFNDTGYLLTVYLFYDGYFEKDHKSIINIEKSPDISMKNIDFYLGDITHRFKDNSAGNPIFSGIWGFQFTIKKSSVLRQIYQVVMEICELWEQTYDKDAVSRVIWQIHKLCAGNKTDNGRYILPDSVVIQMMRLLDSEEEYRDSKQPISVLDPQCGFGDMLITAGRYLKNAELYGMESNQELRISAQILSILMGLTIRDMEADISNRGQYLQYDLVLANPFFSYDNVKFYLWDLPDSLRDMKGQYNLMIVRSLQALKRNGSAALIVPDSFLFSSRNESVKVRKWILDTYEIEMIISLPEKVFENNTTVRSSVLLIHNPERQKPTDRILFYQLNEEAGSKEHEEEYRELLRTRNQSSYYYTEWQKELQDRLENYSNVFVPENWNYPDFWFADYDVIREKDYSFLPDHYRPVEKIKLQFESPAKLLEELIKEQEEILACMHELRREVREL